MRRRTVIIGAVATVVAAVTLVWFVFFRDTAPPPVSLDEAVADVATTAPRADASTPVTTTPEGGSGLDGTGLDGTWVVGGGGSFVGYRVQEELANIGAATAVGRTEQITGELEIAGGVIEAIDIEIDMTTLVSDRSQRDAALRTRGLETETFPAAGFTLTDPVDLLGTPAIGEEISVTVTGDLTLHGTTNGIDIPVQAQLVDGNTIVAVGSIEIALADYAIEAPIGLSVLTIGDVGVVELQLTFTRST